MDERVQPLRRGQNLVMDAEQLDRQDSLARRDNKRVENRLRLEKGSLENHKSNNMYSLNYEMKRLKRELKGIKKTSGHFDLGSSTQTSRTGRRARGKRTRGRNKTSPEGQREDNVGTVHSVTRHNGNQEEKCGDGNKNGQFLPVLCGTSTVRPSRIKERSSNSSANTDDIGPNTERSQRTRVNTLDTDRIAKTEESNNTSKRAGYPPEIEMNFNLKNNHSAEKVDSSFGNLKMDAVKERIQNRLSTTNQVSPYDDSDYTPFMHVPPDGMPRTVYLLPPLQDLLKEAKKARYIRRPKAHVDDQDKDDPERELDIDEIFGKKG